VSDLQDSERAPVLAVAGGAGAMGSLFAELLLPHVNVCLLVDRFATSSGGATGVALAPLAERLGAVMVRQGFDVRLVAGGRQPEGKPPLTGREVRAAPAWLLARLPSAGTPWPTGGDLDGDVAAVVQRLQRFHDISKLVGLLTPEDAASASSLTDLLFVATHYGDDQQFASILAPYVAGIRPGSLVADLLSIKEAPVRALCHLFRPDVGVLGTHPLFGRMPVDVTGLVVATVEASDGRPQVPWQQWLLSRLANLGMLITPTGGGEHDAAMSYVQALTHFTLLCFAYTFVRANQDPTLLLPYRTPVFEPLLYLAARVASLAQHSPEVYRSIQAECTRPEVRRLFVATAQELLAAIEADGDAGKGGRGDEESPASGPAAPSLVPLIPSSPHPLVPPSSHLTNIFQTIGAPWTPSYHRDAEPFEQMVAMSSVLTEPINGLRHTLLRSAGQVKGIRNVRTGAVTLGAVYVDPLHHDRVDLASRLRYQRFNPTSGTLEGTGGNTLRGVPAADRRRIEATLGSLPLAQVQLLSDADMLAWLDANSGPRSGPDDYRGVPDPAAGAARPQRWRYVGKAHFDLSLAVPDWFDNDCLTRLLVGRRRGSGIVTVANLTAQDASGLAIDPGLRAATVRLATVLPPQDVLVLRADVEQPSPGSSAQRSTNIRREEDRRFATAIAQRQGELRQMAHDWLLAHGCAALHRRQ
jgi:prephenate dehydrogenase